MNIPETAKEFTMFMGCFFVSLGDEGSRTDADVSGKENARC